MDRLHRPEGERRTTVTRLSALDATFIEIESPTTPMHVGALTRFEGGPLRDDAGRFRLDDIRRLVEERIGLVPRFRQRLLSVPFDAGRPVWVDDPNFDVAYHVNLTTLPSPGTPEQLRHLTEHLHMQLLDRSRPLWEIWFVDGLADGTIGQIEKIHHALADGVSTVDLATVLMDFTPTPAPRPVTATPWEPSPAPSRASLLLGALADQAAEPARLTRTLWSLATDPRATVEQVRRLARSIPTLVRPQTLAPGTSLNRPVSRTRRLESVRQSLADVKETRAGLGGTVNDVVLAAVTGGLRHLLETRGETIGDRPLQALVPVSMRTEEGRLGLGNEVTAILAPLPVGEPDPVRRLRAVQAAMRDLKDRGQAGATAALMAGSEHLPEPWVAALVRLVHHQPFVNLVVTNVPGPQQPLYLAGARMLESIPIVPLAGNLDVSVGVFSYDGQLTLGLYADAGTCPDVAVLAEGIDKSFAELRYLADRKEAHP